MEYTREQAEQVFGDWHEYQGLSRDLTPLNLRFLDHKLQKLEVEVTLEEVAEKFGVHVRHLKIKK